MKTQTAFLATTLIISGLCLSGCSCTDKEKNTRSFNVSFSNKEKDTWTFKVSFSNIEKITVKYYGKYPPSTDKDNDIFTLSNEQMKEFSGIMPEKLEFELEKAAIGCAFPRGIFGITYKNGNTNWFHFCTSRKKLHGAGSGIPFPVPEKLYPFFVKVLEDRGYKDVWFGASLND